MCDYSLESVQSRPAKVGDRLTTRLFRTQTQWVFCARKQVCCSLLTARHRVVLRKRG